MDEDFGLQRVWSPSEDGAEYDQADARKLRDFDHIGCLVLLGPPGAGKTTELEAAFQEFEVAGRPATLVRLRQVTDRSEFRSLITRGLRNSGTGDEPFSLFLDGLDELPTGNATLRLELLDALVALAEEARSSAAGHPPRLRITCRSAQLPEDFVQALDIAWQGDIALLRLQALTEEDVRLAVTRLSSTDAGQFAYYLDKRGLKSLTSNPMTLRMLVKLFESDEGDLPEDLGQIYRAITSEMLAHVRGLTRQDDPFSLQRARRLLGRLAAVCALSGRYNLWTGLGTDPRPLDAIVAVDASGGIEEVGGRPFQADEGSIRAVMRPGFFVASGPNRLEWPHKSFAEFLAADYLAETTIDRGRLVDLLTIRDAEGARIVPQLREVASWLAGMDAEVRQLLVRSEPVLLMQSDVAGADDGFKAALTSELLDRLEAGGSEAFRFDPTVRPERLLHPGLASLLKPWVRGKHLRISARRFAVDVARNCHLAELSRDLLDVALDESEPAALRASAAAAAGELDATTLELASLRSLLGSGADIDPQDELRGVALRILWPGHLTPEELFGVLSPPRDDTLYGWYKAFIYGLEPSSFDPRTLISGLRWLDRLRGSYQSIMVFRQFIPKLVRAAWAASMDEMVRSALADVLINSASDYGHPTRLFNRGEEDADRPHATASTRAEMFTELMVRAGDDGGALAKWALYVPSPALMQEDLPWLLDQAGQLPEGFLADAICYLAAGRSPDEVARLWELRDDNVEVARAVERLFTTDLHGPAAGWAREAYRHERESRRRPETLNLDARIATSVATCSDRPEEWWRLNLLLLFDETGSGSELSGNLAVAPGWLRATEGTRAAAVRAAYRYLVDYRTESLEWLGTNTFNRAAAAGYRALRLLSLEMPSLYEEVPPEAWAAWTPAVLWFPNNDPAEERAARAGIAARAYGVAPAEFAATVSTILERSGSAYDLAQLLDGCLDERLSEIVWSSVVLGKSDPPSRKALVELLARRLTPAVAAWTRDLLRDESPVIEEKLDGNALEVFAPAAMLEMSAVEIWPDVWARRLLDQPHALAIWRAASVGHSFDLSFLSALPPGALADLYAWLGDVHDGPGLPILGYVTADQELSEMRRRIPALLASMPGDEAATALSRLAGRDAQDGYVRAAIAESREHRLARTCARISPGEVLVALGIRPADEPSRREDIIAMAAANADRDPDLPAAGLLPTFEPAAEALPLQELVAPRPPPRSFLLVATEWRSGFGGVSSLNRELACALAMAGHQVYCLVPEITPGDVDAARALRVELLFASPMTGYSGLELLDACPRPTVTYVDFVLGHDHVTGRAALRIRNEYFPDAAYIHVLHTIPMESEAYKFGGQQPPAARGVIKDKLQLDMCAAADLTLAIGPKIYDRFSPYISDPVRMHQLVPGLSSDLLAVARGVTPVLPRVLWIGRGEDPDLKGLPVAMHLAALLQHEKPDGVRNPKLVVRGLAWATLQEQVDRLREKIPSERRALECLPYTEDRADLIRDYRSAMCLVMPSASEAFGLVALEAIAVCLPVVVSSYSGIGQFLLQQELAPGGISLPVDTVVDVYDNPEQTARSWAAAVLRRLRDPTAAFAEAAKLRDGLAKVLTWDLSARAFVTFLERASGGS